VGVQLFNFFGQNNAPAPAKNGAAEANRAKALVRAITDWLPLTNAVELVRPLFMDQWPDTPVRHVLVLVVYTGVAFALALALTRRRFLA
jgi:ABC-type polysaccharide/polyol phosphate export permease